jgi:hypothetical protein
MASVSRINGFRPVKMITGAPYNGAANLYFVAAANSDVIMIGDVVKFEGSSRDPSGAPTVARHAGGATEAALGVVVDIIYTGVGDVANVPPVTSLDVPIYRAASTNRYLKVVDDPNVVFRAQANGAVVVGDVGQNAEIDVTAGSTTSGSSGMSVDIANKGTTATLPLKIVGFPNDPNNVVGDTYFDVYVTINNHQLKGGTGTAGV